MHVSLKFLAKTHSQYTFCCKHVDMKFVKMWPFLLHDAATNKLKVENCSYGCCRHNKFFFTRVNIKL